MSSDVTVPTGTVSRCQWPGCQSNFIGTPAVTGWRGISLAPGLTLVLCPFHSVDHVPRLVSQAGVVTAVCECRSMLTRERLSAMVALQDWRAHAREINGPEDRVTCAECLRDFESLPSGLVRKHNAVDKLRGRLLSTLCPGAGLPPRELVRP